MGKSIPAIQPTPDPLSAKVLFAGAEREKSSPAAKKEKPALYDSDGFLTEYGKKKVERIGNLVHFKVAQGLVLCTKGNVKYLGDPRHQPIRR